MNCRYDHLPDHHACDKDPCTICPAKVKCQYGGGNEYACDKQPCMICPGPINQRQGVTTIDRDGTAQIRNAQGQVIQQTHVPPRQ